MTIPGSVDNGEVDVEYSPDPDHRQSAQELWFRKCDKRISSLELQVHRMLNPEPISDEWLEAPEYLKGYTDGRASVTRTEGDYAHVPGAIWEALKEELETLRAFKAVLPWKALVTTWLESEQGTPEWNDLHEFTSKFGPSGPVEYMPTGAAE